MSQRAHPSVALQPGPAPVRRKLTWQRHAIARTGRGLMAGASLVRLAGVRASWGTASRRRNKTHQIPHPPCPAAVIEPSARPILFACHPLRSSGTAGPRWRKHELSWAWPRSKTAVLPVSAWQPDLPCTRAQLTPLSTMLRAGWKGEGRGGRLAIPPSPHGLMSLFLNAVPSTPRWK